MDLGDSGDDDFLPTGETTAEQANERVAAAKAKKKAKIRKKQAARRQARVDAQTPAAAEREGGDSDDNYGTKFDQTPILQLELQMTLPQVPQMTLHPEQVPQMPANQQQVSTPPPATPWHAC